MLGYKSFKTNQYYTKILDIKVGDNMPNLKNKLKIANY